MKILVTGATGFVGRAVVKELLDQNHDVVVLTRNIAKAALTLGSKCRYFQWADNSTKAPMEAFEGVHGVINLMGEGIADKPWDDAQKKKIYSSRIEGTARLVEAMAAMPKKPAVLVSASAIGIYGDRGSEELSENSNLGDGFLARICKDWEKETNRAKDLGVRVVIIRTGVVIGKNGGALKKMLPIFKLGLGGKLATGHQYMSWIHLQDLARMYVEAIKEPALTGVFNGVSPYPATNEEFTKVLGSALSRKTFFPVPAFALNLVFGEMSSVLLESQRVLPAHFKQAKFHYHYPTLAMTLKETAF